MRPNMDEYEDVEEAKTVNSRAMSWAVLAVAVGGFAALAYYAYHSGNKATADGEMMVVEADGTPIKEAPANPDGEEFPNQDKTIYDVITPNGAAPTGEKLMPEAEQPVAAMSIEDSEDSAPVAVPPAVVPQQPAPSTTTFVAKEPVVEAPVVAEEKPAVKAAEEKSISNPQIINEKKIVVKKPAPVVTKKEPVKAPAKEIAKTAPKPVVEQPAQEEVVIEDTEKAVIAASETPKTPAVPAESSAYKIQLGAFKSEEEAQSAWAKIRGKHASVLNGSPSIIKAELPNGTFYRLRTGSYSSKAAASDACTSMSGQACMAVK